MTKLNKEQETAVLHKDGPMLILAGAGSGKTRVITERIAALIASGVPSSNILSVTFTNKAASEMRERAWALLGKKPKDLVISTFHAFCVRVLKSDIDKLGYKKNFTIYSTSDCLTLIRSILRELKISTLTYDEKLFAWFIDGWKNRFLHPWEVTPQNDAEGIGVRVYEAYQKYLKGYNALDFNDLINLTITLYIEHKDVLEKYQSRFRYIMVDEYQDTNHSQYKLTSLLASKYKNIVVVGDDDQSIYAFRGADVSNILSFENDYPNAKVITLHRNYRSTRHILEAAHLLIKNNIHRKDKKLTAEAGDGKEITVMPNEDEREEARFIAEDIMQKAIMNKLNYDSFAVLFRMNAQSRLFEEALRMASISYTVVGAFQFYERKEIKDIIAYLKLFVNPEDEVSLLRVINMPKRGIGSGTMTKLMDESIARGEPLYEVLLTAANIKDIPENAQKGINDFIRLIQHYQDIFAYDKDDITLPKLYENINEFLDQIAYESEVINSSDTKEKASFKIENIQSLLDGIMDYEKTNKRATLKGYLDKIVLMSQEEDDDDKPRGVTLLSIHASKGLEFQHVYIVGMEDGILPHHKSALPNEIEEERRLCYVAMTRAQRELTLTYALKRTRGGKSVDCTPSLFLTEISSFVANEKENEDDGYKFYLEMKDRLRNQ